ncbi:Fc receptor-like protein 5 [Fundulus heteroclitus]|uniref:Fc receptor-like protein 5 n=1 Tax=Fundulus heteroclitus TaxID=8078 RepID=UPI00165AA260|nr:Fc receptor-like protein 5 [Fundulus heteroclitus]
MGQTWLCRLGLYLLCTLCCGYAEVSKPTVILQPNWSEIFRGETVTLRCEIQGGGGAQWTYEWSPANRNSPSSSEYRINTATEPYSGDYSCMARRGSEQTEWSSAFRLPSVLYKPRATLTADKTIIPAVGSVALRCSVSSSAGWKYDWFRQESVSSPAQLIRTKEPDGVLRVSEGGVYSCRGGRGDPAFYTETSTEVTIQETAKPVLFVSPSWLSPGASVTLSCEVKPSSAGWRFFWYKAVPERSSSSYSFYPMPGSTNGTEQNSFLINGQNHTAGYVCRARRGESVIYTDYSQPKFVWSADSPPAASLSVSPDRVQHFLHQSVTLNCTGNKTQWRVKSFPEPVRPSSSQCSWRTMTGSSCTIKLLQHHSGVYWCESGSGDFSNAVNITVQNNDGLILVSPVHPVTEGDPVTLSCRDKQQKLLSKVFFYHNDKLLHNDSREELNISAVSKSHEGFYKCQHSGKESPQSWMAVRESLSSPVSSSFSVMLILGPIIGIVLIILLLLLWRYKRPKDLFFPRSKSANQRSTTNDGVETEISEYSSPLQADALYASVKDSPATETAEPKEITYSMIKLKKLRRKKRPREPDERVVYSEVKPAAAEPIPMYAEINHKNKAKKEKKEKSSPAATDESVYSEVK